MSYLVVLPILGLTTFVYYDTIVWLFGRYTAADSYYSHGFLVPFVSGFLIWLRKKELTSVTFEYSVPGLWILLSAISLHIFGTLVHFFFLSGVSLFLFILGTPLFLFGYDFWKKILFPLVFIIFMIPLPLPVISAILFPMKVFVVNVASQIIRMIGTPVYVETFNVHLPEGSLLVGNPCSGLRSLISFLAMGALIAYLRGPSIKKGITILLLSIPIAFVSNILRTVSLILAADHWGIEVSLTDHWFHDFSGLAVFALGLGLLLTITKILDWKSSETGLFS